MSKRKLFKFLKEAQNDAKDQKEYHSGLVGEALIVATWKKTELDKLLKMRFLLNKIIKERKEQKRIQNAKNDSLHNVGDSDPPLYAS